MPGVKPTLLRPYLNFSPGSSFSESEFSESDNGALTIGSSLSIMGNNALVDAIGASVPSSTSLVANSSIGFTATLICFTASLNFDESSTLLSGFILKLELSVSSLSL